MRQCRSLIIGSVALLLGIEAQIASAAGTPAGTAISNSASVDYTAGSNSRNAVSNTVTLYVAHKVAGAFSPASRDESGVDNRIVYLPVDFVNQGNRSDNFSIGFNSNAGYTLAMVHDVNGNGVFDGGEPVITSTGSLAADATIKMLVRITIAANRPDGEAVTIIASLTSTAADDPGSNIVVANPGSTFDFTIDYTVVKPVLVFTGTQSDVSSNPSRIPGVAVTYTMSLTNTGTAGTVGNSTVTFVLDPNFKYVSSTQSGTLSGADGNGNGGTVTWTFTQAQLAVGSPSIPMQVVVEIQQVTNNGTGPASGTTMYAMTTANGTRTKVQYNDGVNTNDQDNADSFNLTVGSASGVIITQVTPDASGAPGDVVEYTFTLKNTGNHTDGYDLTQAHNATGDLDVSHIFSTTPGGSSVTAVTGVAQGATVNFYVRLTIPSGAIDGETVKRDLTVTTQTSSPTAPTGGSVSQQESITTTVAAPTLSVILTNSFVGGVGTAANPAPGDVIRYTITITNAGTGEATSISSSNVNSHLVTNVVVSNSFDIDTNGDGTFDVAGVGGGYSSGGITVTENPGTGFVTVTFSSIPSGQNRKYRYNVEIQ